MEIKPVTSTIGAEIVDVDVRELDDAGAAEIAAAWARHGVVFLRDQHLSPEEHVAFAERFASIDVNQFFQAVDGHPKVAMVLKEPDQTKNIGGGWHTDHSYDEVPARGSILLAHEVPPTGGDTRFLSVAAAYEALSDGLKETLSTLQAHHSNEHIFGEKALKDRDFGDRLGNPEAVGGAIHPVVISHPDTGEKLLYVNPGFTTHFVGWTERESKALLGFLYEHITSPEFTIQFKWEPGSIAMWDNRSTWHWALNDYDGHRRLMHRITVSGVPLSAAA
ncbi:MAG: TauD/TfdA dioxygenase family protein [Acidimicrobiales bacterium]